MDLEKKFGTSSYNERELRKKNSGTRVSCKVLEFRLNFFKELEYFTWNLSSKKIKFIFQFAITQLSKNRVLN